MGTWLSTYWNEVLNNWLRVKNNLAWEKKVEQWGWGGGGSDLFLTQVRPGKLSNNENNITLERNQ